MSDATKKSSASPAAVRDVPERHRFELELDGHTAFVEYTRAPGKITLVHTVVPDALGGRGVGSALARGTLVLVRKSGEKVIAECPFIAAFIQKNKEFQDLQA